MSASAHCFDILFTSFSLLNSIATVGFHMVMSLVKSRFSIFFCLLFFSRARSYRVICLFGWFSFFFFLLLCVLLMLVSAPFTSAYLPKKTNKTNNNRSTHLLSFSSLVGLCIRHEMPISLDQVSNSD